MHAALAEQELPPTERFAALNIAIMRSPNLRTIP
jgi:hypothetical protein